jgi:hypothetical protein
LLRLLAETSRHGVADEWFELSDRHFADVGALEDHVDPGESIVLDIPGDERSAADLFLKDIGDDACLFLGRYHALYEVAADKQDRTYE